VALIIGRSVPASVLVPSGSELPAQPEALPATEPRQLWMSAAALPSAVDQPLLSLLVAALPSGADHPLRSGLAARSSGADSKLEALLFARRWGADRPLLLSGLAAPRPTGANRARPWVLGLGQPASTDSLMMAPSDPIVSEAALQGKQWGLAARSG
jgi:hypothetical protein